MHPDQDAARAFGYPRGPVHRTFGIGVGLHVMLLNNDPFERRANGSIGRVERTWQRARGAYRWRQPLDAAQMLAEQLIEVWQRVVERDAAVVERLRGVERHDEVQVLPESATLEELAAAYGHLVQGARVCFTGEVMSTAHGSFDRDNMRRLAEELGLAIAENMTKTRTMSWWRRCAASSRVGRGRPSCGANRCSLPRNFSIGRSRRGGEG